MIYCMKCTTTHSISEMDMNTVHVRKGDDSDPITCKFHQVNAVYGQPDGLVFSDGTNTWNPSHSDSNAVVSVSPSHLHNSAPHTPFVCRLERYHKSLTI